MKHGNYFLRGKRCVLEISEILTLYSAAMVMCKNHPGGFEGMKGSWRTAEALPY